MKIFGPCFNANMAVAALTSSIVSALQSRPIISPDGTLCPFGRITLPPGRYPFDSPLVPPEVAVGAPDVGGGWWYATWYGNPPGAVWWW